VRGGSFVFSTPCLLSFPKVKAGEACCYRCQGLLGKILPLRFPFLSLKFGHKIKKLRYVKSQTTRPAEMYNGKWKYNIKIGLNGERDGTA
jgi:hypothetical protein